MAWGRSFCCFFLLFYMCVLCTPEEPKNGFVHIPSTAVRFEVGTLLLSESLVVFVNVRTLWTLDDIETFQSCTGFRGSFLPYNYIIS